MPAGLGAFHVPFNNETSYVDTWNFTIQRQLSSTLTTSMAYVGNVGRRMYDDYNLIAPFPGPGSLNSRRALDPLGIDTNVDVRCHCTNANYNSLQWVLDKRFGMGYEIHSAYTWSKALDRPFGGFGWSSQNENPHDRNASYGIDENSRASVWTLSHVWHLPYGRGLHWGSSASSVEQAALGGWVFNGITSVMSGFPVGINWSDTSSLNGAFGQRPDLVGNPNAGIPAGRIYNPAAFANPNPVAAIGQTDFSPLGGQRSQVTGPPLRQLDLGFAKQVKILGQRQFEIRAEAFNITNTPAFNLPGSLNFLDAKNFASITSMRNAPRQIQLGAKVYW